MAAADPWPSTRRIMLRRMRDREDPQAWQRFVELYGPAIYRFAVGQGLQDADAKEVVQNVLIRLRRHLAELDLDPARGRFRDWLGTVTFNEIQRRRGQLNRLGRGPGGDGGQAVVERLDGEAEAAWIAEFNSQLLDCALKRVRARCSETVWLAFELTWLHDRKPREVAAELDQRVEWVYKAKYRLLNRLQSEIEEASLEGMAPGSLGDNGTHCDTPPGMDR